MKVQHRIITSYVVWGITAFATTLTWTTIGSRSFSGQNLGRNGSITLILAVVCAGLVLWWDRDGRLDEAKIKAALFSGALAIAVVVRNVYDIGTTAGADIGYGLWICLLGSLAGSGVLLSLRR